MNARIKKIVLPFLIVILCIITISIFLLPELSHNLRKFFIQLGIIPMAVGPKTFTYTILGSNLNELGKVITYYSFANDTTGNPNTTQQINFVVLEIPPLPTTTAGGGGGGGGSTTTIIKTTNATTTTYKTTTPSTETTIVPTVTTTTILEEKEKKIQPLYLIPIIVVIITLTIVIFYLKYMKKPNKSLVIEKLKEKWSQ